MSMSMSPCSGKARNTLAMSICMDSNQVPGVCASSNTTMQQIGWQFVMFRNDNLLPNDKAQLCVTWVPSLGTLGMLLLHKMDKHPHFMLFKLRNNSILKCKSQRPCALNPKPSPFLA